MEVMKYYLPHTSQDTIMWAHVTGIVTCHIWPWCNITLAKTLHLSYTYSWHTPPLQTLHGSSSWIESTNAKIQSRQTGCMDVVTPSWHAHLTRVKCSGSCGTSTHIQPKGFPRWFKPVLSPKKWLRNFKTVEPVYSGHCIRQPPLYTASLPA